MTLDLNQIFFHDRLAASRLRRDDKPHVFNILVIDADVFGTAAKKKLARRTALAGGRNWALDALVDAASRVS